MSDQNNPPVKLNGNTLEIVRFQPTLEEAKRIAEEDYEFFFRDVHPELIVISKKTKDFLELRADQGLVGHCIKATVARGGRMDRAMLVPSIDVREYKSFQVFTDDKQMDVQGSNDNEHWYSLLEDGLLCPAPASWTRTGIVGQITTAYMRIPASEQLPEIGTLCLFKTEATKNFPPDLLVRFV